MTALSLRDVSVRRGGRPVLEGITFDVTPGEVVAVVGPNGAGKTTLLRAALGLERLSGGQVSLGGHALATLSLTERARLAAYLPQERRVGWNMSATLVASLGAPGAPPAAANQRAAEALARVGLEGLATRGVLDMSGGERARVLLARLLVAQAPLVTADEPVAGLDPDAQHLALELLREEAARGAGVVVTLHDLALAARYCDRLIVIDHGRLVVDGAPEAALTPAVLAQVFGLAGRLEITDEGPVLIAGRRRGA